MSASYAVLVSVTFDVLVEDLDLHNDIGVALNELRVELGSLPVHIPESSR